MMESKRQRSSSHTNKTLAWRAGLCNCEHMSFGQGLKPSLFDLWTFIGSKQKRSILHLSASKQ